MRARRLGRLTIGCLMAGMYGPALSQGDESTARAADRSLDLGTIVVSNVNNPVESLPASTTVVRGGDIVDRSPLQQGVDLLRGVPGLQVSTLSQGAFRERFIMRGFASAGETVASFLDGVPLNESNGHGDGTIDLSTMIPEEIDRVEVIKGPFSALYGNFARAGSINFITKNRVNENIARLSIGAWNTQRAAGTIGRTGERLSQYYAVDFYHTDGWRENSETVRSNMSARWTYDLSDKATLRFGGRSYAAKWDAPGYLTEDEWNAGEWQSSNTQLDGGEKERYDLNFNFNYAVSPSDSLGVTAFLYSTDFHRWRDNGAPQTEEHNVLSGKMVKLLYSKQGSYLTRQDSLLFGIDFLREDGERRTWNNTTPWMRSLLTADGEYYQNTYSAYGQWEMKPSDPLSIVLGVRYDYFDVSLDQRELVANQPTGNVVTSDNDLSAFSPKLGIAYTLSPEYAVFGNVGKGFHLPSMFDKFTNPQLDPVDLISYELGVRFAPTASVRGSIALFRIDSKDDVTREGGPTGPLVNAGDVRRQGIDAELNVNVTDELMFIAHGSYIDAEFRNYLTGGVDLSGNVPTEVPPYFYSLGLDYFHPGLSAGARLTYNGKGEVWLDNANSFRYGSYTYTDAQLYWINGPYTIDLKLGNLTDERYAEYTFSGTGPGSQRYGPARPFNVTLSLKAEF